MRLKVLTLVLLFISLLGTQYVRSQTAEQTSASITFAVS